ncbi:MAG: F0F1 ATP synthase subunit alpha, partial [Acidimicrobiia bacterium]
MTDVGILDAEAWSGALDDRLDRLGGAIDTGAVDRPVVGEVGRVRRVDAGIAEVDGLPGVRSEELVSLGDGVLALALDLGRDRLGVVLLDPPGELKAGDPVRRGERVLSVPVGAGLVGRVVGPPRRPRAGGGGGGRPPPRPGERPA